MLLIDKIYCIFIGMKFRALGKESSPCQILIGKSRAGTPMPKAKPGVIA
jgi:hypothetical protein